jgi:hypothetical protein
MIETYSKRLPKTYSLGKPIGFNGLTLPLHRAVRPRPSDMQRIRLRGDGFKRAVTTR